MPRVTPTGEGPVRYEFNHTDKAFCHWHSKTMDKDGRVIDSSDTPEPGYSVIKRSRCVWIGGICHRCCHRYFNTLRRLNDMEFVLEYSEADDPELHQAALTAAAEARVSADHNIEVYREGRRNLERAIALLAADHNKK